MMFPPPFFSFPRYMTYPRYSYGCPNYSKYINSKTPQLHCNSTKTHYNNNENESVLENSEDRTYFEIMGIKLYFDDILLICLIFFLYNEGVQDEMLFMALVLLLLS